MNGKQIIDVAAEVARLVVESRLRDFALIAQTDRSDRIRAVAAVISKFPPGGYLIGCGPYSCGIVPLTVDELVLGRPPSPLEGVPESVADFTLNDAVWMLPREASRIHASIIRRTVNGNARYWVRDERSRAGTYVNCRQVEAGEDAADIDKAVELTNGDILSLGPSGVNAYVFYVAS